MSQLSIHKAAICLRGEIVVTYFGLVAVVVVVRCSIVGRHFPILGEVHHRAEGHLGRGED
jgi:hypothetical protein